MKNLVVLLLLLASCGNPEIKKSMTEEDKALDEIDHSNRIKSGYSMKWEIRCIDSCEYIVGYGNGLLMTHRGRCKYCKQRRNDTTSTD